MIERYKNFDYLRGLAILAVILIHVTAPTAIAEEPSGIVLNQIPRFGVPVFVFLSGWGLTVAESYERSSHYFDFLKKRLMKLIPKYLVWNLIYYLFALVIEQQSISLIEFFQGVVIGRNYPHLYFVPLITLFYMVYPLLMKLGEKPWGVGLTFILTMASLVMHPNLGEQFTQNQNPLNWLFYFVFGIWVANYYEEIKKKLHKTWVLLFFSISTVFIVLEPLFFMTDPIFDQTRPSIVFFSVFIILLTMVFPNWLNPFRKMLHPIGEFSFSIYLSHYLFTRIFRLLLPAISNILLFILVLASSVVLAVIEKKVIR